MNPACESETNFQRLAFLKMNPACGSKTFWSLTLVAIVLFTVNLGSVPLRDWDEGTRGLIAKEIWNTGNWLHPTAFGQPYLLKPPLMDWLIALCYRLGGVTEVMTRLPGAIATALGVPFLYLLGRELWVNRSTAVLSATVYLTLLPVVRHGRLAMLDGMVMTGLIFSLWCLCRSQKQSLYGLGVGLGLGWIAMTKGLLVLPLGLILGIFILSDRRWSIFKNPYLWLGLGLGLLPILIWYLAQIQFYGDRFMAVHFQGQGFDRLTETVENHHQPIYYYLLEIAKYSLPWLLFFPFALNHLYQNRSKSDSRLIVAGIAFYLPLISLMGTKLPWYVMPIYPFLALSIGSYLGELWQMRQKPPKFLKYIFGVLAITLLGGGIYLAYTDPQPPLLLLALNGVIMFSIVNRLWPKYPQRILLTIIIGTYGCLFFLMNSQSWVWEINEAFAVKPVATLIQNTTPPQTTIYTSFSYHRPSLDFYSDRPVLPASPDQIQILTQSDHYLLLDSASYSNIQSFPHQLLGKTPDFYLVHTTQS